MQDIELPTYRVSVDPGALDRVGERLAALVPRHRPAIITDTVVGALHGERLTRQLSGRDSALFEIRPGERQKTRGTWADLTDRLLAAGFGRDTVIVALGGGVVGDLAGFVAATYMRGVPYVQVPTTLLAMVDSSIGGKTGVDTPVGKNLVGAFHQPIEVLIDPSTLDTLPVEQLCSGLAEVIKHGVIGDADYFEEVAALLPSLVGPDRSPLDAETMAGLIARSVAIKAEVVRRDEREAGLRQILNFGHTLGHAIEMLSGYAMLHGEAVAIGMVLEARLAEHAGMTGKETADRILAAVAAAALPGERPRGMRPEAILAATRADKKVRAGAVRYALPSAIGTMAGMPPEWSFPIDDSLVLKVLA